MTEKPAMLTPDQLRKAFTDAVTELDNAKSNQVITNLSHALAALQEAGISVSFDVTGWVGDDTFKPVSGSGGSAVFSGFLNIGNNRHILSMIDMKDKTILSISYFNATLGIGSDSRMWAYDITDPECYTSLQQQIVTLAARNAYIAERDVNGAFNNGQAQDASRAVRLIKPQRQPAK